MSARAAFAWAFVLFVVLSITATMVALAAHYVNGAKFKSNEFASRLAVAVADDAMAARMNARPPYSMPAVGVWQ